MGRYEEIRMEVWARALSAGLSDGAMRGGDIFYYNALKMADKAVEEFDSRFRHLKEEEE